MQGTPLFVPLSVDVDGGADGGEAAGGGDKSTALPLEGSKKR